MSKYFKEEETKKIKLSEYLQMEESEFKYYLCDEKYRQPRTKYIIGIIGDVELDEETYKLFLRQFQCYGGRYDVRTKKETIKGIYDISQKYPSLTAKALDSIWSVYIQDQFEEYALDEMLGKYIEIHGKTEDALDAYLDYVNKKADEFAVKFEEDAESLEKYKEEYGQDLIENLQSIVKRQHISASEIEKSLPSKELIEKDKQQLGEISRQTRIFMGMCQPISYQMIESLATGKGLDMYPEQPSYIINGQTEISASFTKQEFLDSIEKKDSDRKEDKPKQYKKI